MMDGGVPSEDQLELEQREPQAQEVPINELELPSKVWKET